MKKISRFILPAILILAVNISAAAQIMQPTAISANSGSLYGLAGAGGRPAPDSRAWTDPAMNHNKLFQSTDGMYKMIGPYKVLGSCFLFGEQHKADMYATEAKALNIYVSYNTYNQEVEFYSTSNPDKPLVKEPGDIDSFTIQANIERGITSPLKFVYGSILGTKDKYYYQEVCKGSRFTLYKRYKTDLGYSSTNLAQSELRQFDLAYEYYYTDTESKGVKKIKANENSVIKEFKSVQDLSAVVTNEDFTENPEAAFCKVMSSLNGVKKGF